MDKVDVGDIVYVQHETTCCTVMYEGDNWEVIAKEWVSFMGQGQYLCLLLERQNPHDLSKLEQRVVTRDRVRKG